MYGAAISIAYIVASGNISASTIAENPGPVPKSRTIDGFLSPLKIGRDMRESYSDERARIDLFTILDKFCQEMVFLRRVQEYINRNPNGDIYAEAHEIHLQNCIDENERIVNIDFNID